MHRSMKIVLSAAATMVMVLGGCSSGGSAGGGSGDTLTLAGWSLASTPEFQALADGFNATNPAHKVEVKEYDATNYDTQMIADLAAGTAPDIYVQKNPKNFFTYQSGEQLLDVSDIAGELDPNVKGAEFYQVDGKTWAIPYRQDGQILYYNKDLFKKAGVAEPDGSWTWDDYGKAAEELAPELKSDGAKGTYQHNWQSIVQAPAYAQSPGADILSADYGFMKPYYEQSLDLQAAGAQEDYGNVVTNKLTYQAQFGTQKTAMMTMGTWYIATLITQQKNGEAQDFEWGIAPLPQYDSSTAGLDKIPVTVGDPTGLGINAGIDKGKVETAKAFLRYVASADAATSLTGVGITPAYASDAITEAFFTVEGTPTDDLSKFAFGTRDIRPENPVSEHTAAIQNILNETDSAIRSKSVSVDEGLTQAQQRVKAEVLNG